MPRITVTTDIRPDQGEPAVLFDELVHSVHLSTGHAAAQLVERLAWAIIDAELSAGERPRQPAPARERISAHTAAIRARRARPLAV
jgi:hypothetical protein